MLQDYLGVIQEIRHSAADKVYVLQEQIQFGDGFDLTPPCTWWQDSSFDSGFCRPDNLLQNFPLRLPHERNRTTRATGSRRSSNTVDVVFHRRRHREVYHLSKTAASSRAIVFHFCSASMIEYTDCFDSINVKTSSCHICCHQNINLFVLKTSAEQRYYQRTKS